MTFMVSTLRTHDRSFQKWVWIFTIFHTVILLILVTDKPYHKNPKNSDTENIIVIILKFEQCGFTIEKCVQKM